MLQLEWKSYIKNGNLFGNAPIYIIGVSSKGNNCKTGEKQIARYPAIKPIQTKIKAPIVKLEIQKMKK